MFITPMPMAALQTAADGLSRSSQRVQAAGEAVVAASTPTGGAPDLAGATGRVPPTDRVEAASPDRPAASPADRSAPPDLATATVDLLLASNQYTATAAFADAVVDLGRSVDTVA